jgi:hypothetical protein
MILNERVGDCGQIKLVHDAVAWLDWKVTCMHKHAASK